MACFSNDVFFAMNYVVAVIMKRNSIGEAKKVLNSTDLGLTTGIDEYLILCPPSLVQLLSRNTPHLQVYEKEIRHNASFSHCTITSYLRSVTFIAQQHPEEFSGTIKASKSSLSTPHKKSALSEKVQRLQPLPQIYTDIRDPSHWSDFEANIALIVQICDCTVSEESEKALYILSRLIYGVLSDVFYKSIASAIALAEIINRASKGYFLKLVGESIVSMLEKICNYDSKLKLRDMDDLKGINQQKMSVGIILLVLAGMHLLKLSSSLGDMIPSSFIAILLDSLCAASKAYAPILPWAFSILCHFAINSKLNAENYESISTHLGCSENGNALFFKQTMHTYLLEPIFMSMHRSNSKKEVSTAQPIIEGVYMEKLIKELKFPAGVFGGYHSMYLHPLFKGYSNTVQEHCSRLSSSDVHLVIQSIKSTISGKLDSNVVSQRMAMKFFYDNMCRILLTFSSGPQTNEDILEVFIEAREAIGTYILPAAKCSSVTKEELQNPAYQDTFMDRIRALIAQFEDAMLAKYFVGDSTPAARDFTIDSSDGEDEEESFLRGGGSIQLEKNVGKDDSLSTFLGMHVLKSLEHFSRQVLSIKKQSLVEKALSTLIPFYFSVAFSKKDKKDLSGLKGEDPCRERSMGIILMHIKSHWSLVKGPIVTSVRHYLHDFTASAQRVHYEAFTKLILQPSENIDLYIIFVLNILWSYRCKRLVYEQGLYDFIENFVSNEIQTESFLKLFSAVHRGRSNGALQACLAEKLEEYIADNCKSTPVFFNHLKPVFEERYFPAKSYTAILNEYHLQIERKKVPRLLETSDCQLRILSSIFRDLAIDKQADLLLKWTVFAYLVTKVAHSELQQLFFEIVNWLAALYKAFKPKLYVAQSGEKIFIACDENRLLQPEAETYLKNLLSIWRTIFFSKSNERKGQKIASLKKLASTGLTNLISGLEFTQVDDATKLHEDSLIAAISTFAADVIQCRLLSTEAKKRILQCFDVNATFLANHISVSLAAPMCDIISVEGKSSDTFSLQSMNVATEFLTRALRNKIQRKEYHESMKKVAMSLFAACAKSMARVSSKAFMEIAGLSLFRLLNTLKSLDESLQKDYKKLLAAVESHIRASEHSVHPRKLHAIRCLQ